MGGDPGSPRLFEAEWGLPLPRPNRRRYQRAMESCTCPSVRERGAGPEVHRANVALRVQLWGKPVHLETSVEGKEDVLFSFDGKNTS
jgi:hypothetical protein